MTSADVASWAALVVAAVAMFIAFSQVAQQYIASGQLIRLCDSVVYGGSAGLPGKGHRVWSWTQFRYRVLYEVPIFNIPRNGDDVRDTILLSSRRFGKEADYQANEAHWAALSSESQVGEASWVSFCRKIKDTCHERCLITLKCDDADRIPQELPNIPVPISLRDIIVMSLTIGLNCTEASFSRRSLAMQGRSGAITSSNHPVLGPLIHFAPQINPLTHPQPKYWRNWIARVVGDVPVGNDVLPWSGKGGLAFFEQADFLLAKIRKHLESGSRVPLDKSLFEDEKKSIAEQRKRVNSQLGTVELFPEEVDSSSLEMENDQISTLTLGSFHSNSSTVRPSSDNKLSHLWYWLSQMNIFEGYFASPWRDDIDATVCARALSIILKNVVDSRAVELPRIRLRYFFENEATGGDIPFVSFPPYAVTSRRYRNDSNNKPPLAGWHFFPSFNCKLPDIAVLADNDLNISDESSFNFESRNAVLTVELVRFDYWLHRAAEAECIVKGGANVVRNTPAIVQFVLQSYYEQFTYCYVTGYGRIECARSIRSQLYRLGLSEAEVIFVSVAMLRTLRYAFCIGSGLNTRPAQEILKNDLPAHIV